MKSKILLLSFLFFRTVMFAQEINVEYDKNRDFSKYKTFSFGESEIITPKDQKVYDSNQIHGWVRDAITRELEIRGLKKTDSLGDLTASYVIGSSSRSEIENVGPLGGTPGMVAQPRSSMRDFNMGSFIIDLKDKSKNLVWRVNAETMLTSTEVQSSIDEIVVKGFKKYGKPVKSKKKK
ncbi:MAG TPA: DUF4136 domain-containing protein [Cyclobacteriaceae bacterium]|jgi:hypothetical protein|nr:DUF4136 domain-containing protein [Cyclobacteriaceae bacterium]